MLLTLAAAGMAAAAPSIDVPALIQRSVEANNRDWQAAPNYRYLETDRDHDGGKTYQVLMILGSPYRKLVALQGEPLSAARQADEQRRLERTIALRRRESPSQRAQRVSAYRQGRERDRELIEQLTRAFNFRLVGEQQLGQHTVVALRAAPRPGYHPPTTDTKVLTGMQGELWIDPETSQWVKVEAEVIHPVWIEGFLARVDPGTRFELEYTPVTRDVWLPSHFAMSSRAKVLLLFSKRGQADETYSGYRKTEAQPVSKLARPASK